LHVQNPDLNLIKQSHPSQITLYLMLLEIIEGISLGCLMKNNGGFYKKYRFVVGIHWYHSSGWYGRQ